MPMNKFLFDHQLAAMKVDGSGTAEERSAKADLVGSHAKRMVEWRKANGLSNVGWPRDERPKVPEKHI